MFDKMGENMINNNKITFAEEKLLLHTVKISSLIFFIKHSTYIQDFQKIENIEYMKKSFLHKFFILSILID